MPRFAIRARRLSTADASHHDRTTYGVSEEHRPGRDPGSAPDLPHVSSDLRGKRRPSSGASSDGHGVAERVPRPIFASALKMLGIGLTYVLLAELGLTYVSGNPSVSPFWPPTGFAIAALLIWDFRMWPAILAGAFAVNMMCTGTIQGSVIIAAGNTLEALAGAYLARVWSTGRETFETPAGVVKFAIIGPIAACISATLGVVSLTFTGNANTADVLQAWKTWWSGDVAGALVVAPVVIFWVAKYSAPQGWAAVRDAGVAYLAAIFVGFFAFGPVMGVGSDRGPLGFLAILPLLWAALRCSPRETATVALILSGFAVWGTVMNGGVFVREDVNDSFLMLVTFMFCTAVPTLALSADVAVRRKAQIRLRRQELDLLKIQEDLERRVEQRTAALASMNSALQNEIEQRRRVEADLNRDIAERHKAQQALIESERNFRLLVDGVTDCAIIMLDPEGRIANWNTGAQRINGFSASEIIGRHFACFHSEADQRAGRPQRSLEIAALVGKHESEGWRLRKDGSRFWANIVVHAVHDESGALIGFAKVARDMTERREAQAALDRTREELYHAQKMEALGHLTGGLAHDFNNFLTAVIGNIELVRASGINDLNDRRLESALQAARQGATLIRQMLVFARKQPLEVGSVDVNEVIQEILPLVFGSCPENIRIRTQLTARPAVVNADSSLLQTSILNLALNARDAMPDGGTLTIATMSHGRSDNLDYKLWGDAMQYGDCISIDVRDTGIGMSKEVLEHALEPFFTTKEPGKGTGLGLSTVYGATREMGGDIVLESEPGRGTIVRIMLPAGDVETRPADRPVEDVANNSLASATPVSVLCVEDDPLVGAATAEILESAGFRTVTVSSAEKALAVLKGRPDIPLVVTDIGLPGMDGQELVARVRKDRPELMVLFISGYERRDNGAHRQADFRTDYIGKPYDSRDLLRRVQNLLSTGATAKACA